MLYIDEMEIYLSHCGCTCPNDDRNCPYCDFDGLCQLTEPWFDCDDFVKARGDEISAAELEIEDNS